MKKLYVVDVKHTVYVLAEDALDAEAVAVRGIREYGDAPECDVSPVRKNEPIPKDWQDAMPFGDDDGKTIMEIVKAL